MASEFEDIRFNTPNDMDSVKGEDTPKRFHPVRIRKPNTRIFGDNSKDSSMKFVTPSSARKKKNIKKMHKLNPHKRMRMNTPLQRRLERGPLSPRSSVGHGGALVASGAVAVNSMNALERQRMHRFGARLRNFLKLAKPYKWVCYEWFYANLDKCLFSGDNDFCVCLREYFPKLQTRKLTRSEWNRVRHLMGRPRRCSPAFFYEERQVLYKKREKLRRLQQRKLTALDDISDMPKDIPMPIVVGTCITAHVEDGVYNGLYTGVIDAIDTVNSEYRVTFDKSSLGTRTLPDINVMSNDLPETMPAAAFVHKDRPSQTSTSSNYSSITSLFSPQLTNMGSGGGGSGLDTAEYDPILSGLTLLTGEGCLTSPMSSKLPTDLGTFPVKFLMMISQLGKILAYKSDIINRLKQMHSVAEFQYKNMEYDNHFQIQYANAVVKLETLNKTLTEVLLLIQHADDNGQFLGMKSTEPRPAIEGNLRTESYIEAQKIVMNCNTKNGNKMITSPRMLKLITMLVSLLVQVKIFAEKEIPSFEYVSLHKTLTEIKEMLMPENIRQCENRVDVHIRHIETGLSQVGNQTAFSTQDN